MKVFGSSYHLLVDHQTWGLNHQTWGSTLLYRTKFHGHVYPITILVVVGCYMCNGQNMECFLMKGNGHPITDRDFHCSHHTSSRRMDAPNIFPHCSVSWFWHIRFSCLNYTWCIPHVPCPKHHSRVGAMKKHRGLCGSAEWPKLPLHLGVVGRWSEEYLLTVSGKKTTPE